MRSCPIFWAWTDSAITLCWIRAPPAKWKTFIWNRVSQVQKLTGSALWRHIPSELNPADLASRGSLPSKIIKNELRWQELEFLRHQWDAPFPEQPSCLETLQEARPIKVHCGTVGKEGINFMSHLLAKFSSLSRAITYRVGASCLRFRRTTGALRRISNVLPPDELEEALARVVSVIQR